MWMIEKSNEVRYNEKSHQLTTCDGHYIAQIYTLPDETLEIWLAMDTNFESESGEIHGVGWNGCEEHIASRIRIWGEDGTLDYQEGRISSPSEKRRRVFVRIKNLNGTLITGKTSPAQKKGLLRSFLCGQES